METVALDLGLIHGVVNVIIARKKIKNVHLKVYRDLSVVLSVPEKVPDEWIQNFLNDRRQWIEKQIQKYKESGGSNTLLDIGCGTSTQLLGKDVRIYREKSDLQCVKLEEKSITIYCNDITDTQTVQKIFEQWWRSYAVSVYQNEMNVIFDRVFRKYGLTKPSIIIRKMKTLWGSCTPQKSKITLNEYLLKADVRCIQYVVLHELTHLLYPDHSKSFYDFLTIQMPDWQERKKQLDTEVVQGL